MVSTDTHNEVPEATASATHGSNSVRPQSYVHFLDPDKIVLPDALSDQLLDQQQWSVNAQIQEPSLLNDVVPNRENPTIVTLNQPVLSYVPIFGRYFDAWFSIMPSRLGITSPMSFSSQMRFAEIDPYIAPRSDPLGIKRRLAELRDLRDGWADGMQNIHDWGSGFGKAPSHDGLDWLAAQFERFYPEDVPRPRLYPTPEGGVQAEWALGDLEIDIDAHTAEWFDADVDDESMEEHILNLDDPADWQLITDLLRRDPN